MQSVITLIWLTNGTATLDNFPANGVVRKITQCVGGFDLQILRRWQIDRGAVAKLFWNCVTAINDIFSGRP